MPSGKDWQRQVRKAQAALRARQRIARQQWQRAPASPGAGMTRLMPPQRDDEEGAMTCDCLGGDDSIASDK